MLNYFFEKQLRLSNSISFQNVFKKSYKKTTGEIIILGRFNLLEYPRLGLSISRKNIKYSHDRNLIKRLIRETFRLLQHQLVLMDYIVITKKNVLYLTNKKIIDMLKILWLSYRR
ncbi:MAG: ribonuclease P protein component [Buchnera aphidicola (Brevicoryne brassicae)]|uniref:Ribonuclease P protein component n=1 Tax=Buchnera aphidicola (Brevicoryne brassicae) TaxID=911343 RepID=A0AAJ5PU61_9GAMM|nr:ribonuclease P protein component [Buchnera aphidicola]QCI19603.1 ribonuclease P protein component [Buchnera aphidicola (Brevicoryne brassicae)]WAI18974.1 MAG: ribonuclease P protein component [Buchnera aphidicola (Brevicoryne brassicae)]